MQRLRAFNKFYRRYEVDLWGRIGFQNKNKTVRFLNKIQKEKTQFSINPGRSFQIRKPSQNSLFKDKEKILNFSSKDIINVKAKQKLNRLIKKRKILSRRRELLQNLKSAKNYSYDLNFKFVGNNLRLKRAITRLSKLRDKRLAKYYTSPSSQDIIQNNIDFIKELKLKRERKDKEKEKEKHNKEREIKLALDKEKDNNPPAFNFLSKTPDFNRVSKLKTGDSLTSKPKFDQKKTVAKNYKKNIKYKKKSTSKPKFKKKTTLKTKEKKLPKKPRQFIYRIDYADPQRKRAKTSLARELFLVKTKLLRFYNNIKKDQIRRYANTKTFKLKFKVARGYTNRALLKYNSSNSLKKRLALNGFFSLVEHRLDVLLFRSNLVTTIQQARQLINHRHVFVNEKCITHSCYILNNFDVISLSKKMERCMKSILTSNIKKRKITFYPPRYIYTDYRLMRASLVSNPLVRQVPFPFKVDLRKWLGLAKYMF